ncbi:hypothetical protein ACFL5O_04260 [Myxococcota bacterium]
MYRDLLLALMMGLPAHHLDQEDDVTRRARLGVIAQAVRDAAMRATCRDEYAQPECGQVWPGSPLQLALLLVTEAYWESRLSRNIHQGQCRSFECDPVRSPRTGRIEHRARTLWQVHRSAPIAAEWDQMIGVDLRSTRMAAWAATKLLSFGYRSCRTVSGAISRYAGVRRCDWSGATRRVAMFESLERRAARLRAKAAAEEVESRSPGSAPALGSLPRRAREPEPAER